MTVLAIVAALRVIPYLLVLFIAIRKGFKYLTLAVLYLLLVLVVNYTIQPSLEWRNFLSSIFALLLMLHGLDLRTRRGTGV